MPTRSFEFPPETSSGYLVRDANRAFQRLLERRLAPHGVTRGQWYFLRALWAEDGLTQRELSLRVGTMEPTTVVALRGMEKVGLVSRARSAEDRRKVHVRLTARAKRLKAKLLPLARDITVEAGEGITPGDIERFHDVLRRMAANLDRVER